MFNKNLHHLCKLQKIRKKIYHHYKDKFIALLRSITYKILEYNNKKINHVRLKNEFGIQISILIIIQNSDLLGQFYSILAL